MRGTMILESLAVDADMTEADRKRKRPEDDVSDNEEVAMDRNQRGQKRSAATELEDALEKLQWCTSRPCRACKS